MKRYRLNYGNGQVHNLGSVPLRVAKHALEAQREADRRFGQSSYDLRLQVYVGDDAPDGWITVQK